MRDNLVEKLLTLFTSPERAETIAGDLAEEREQRGWIWFWWHAASITFALWGNAARAAPFRVIGLMMAGCAIFTVPAFGGAAAVLLFPRFNDSPVSWIALSFFWWGGALGTGASLVAIAPRHGMAACATLAATGAALMIGLGAMAVWHDWLKGDFLLSYTSGLFAAAPLLAGGVIARSILTVEQHR